MKLYVTYGLAYDQRNGYSVVEGKDYQACRDTVFATCGPDFAFTYTEEQFAHHIERYKLHEIPLQPQTRSGYYD